MYYMRESRSASVELKLVEGDRTCIWWPYSLRVLAKVSSQLVVAGRYLEADAAQVAQCAHDVRHRGREMPSQGGKQERQEMWTS